MIDPNLTKSKTCSRCKELKSLSEFNRNGANKDGLQKNCKACQSFATRRWQKNNRDAANRAAKKYAAGRRKEYLAENPQFSVYYRDYGKRWLAENKDKQKIYKWNRRARIMDSGGEFTSAEFQELCKKYDYKCLSCKEVKPLAADHVVALARGGANVIDNIQPLCRSCNSRKGTKTIDFRV